ncbi:uncharacterized protein BDZ99DRAFT_244954 [Mytilinidion resinicola]|uniref:Uncharacterized protein n=1 Tax=Mytilinidion resinicola TaxID=574789 RepID=A0A6A6YX08_9PEZI|nr:uncharacterized protein BDZ99DRAFT_244954 [Mytilinidion resinicola]KAF2812933.1 hypothetical protein BDZ99DRAFT_244954 [Mytilinidion resinicola]
MLPEKLSEGLLVKLGSLPPPLLFPPPPPPPLPPPPLRFSSALRGDKIACASVFSDVSGSRRASAFASGIETPLTVAMPMNAYATNCENFMVKMAVRVCDTGARYSDMLMRDVSRVRLSLRKGVFGAVFESMETVLEAADFNVVPVSTSSSNDPPGRVVGDSAQNIWKGHRRKWGNASPLATIIQPGFQPCLYPMRAQHT